MIDQDKIKPKEKGKSDFFSWQLYRFVRKYKDGVRIYLGNWNAISGHESDPKTIYISCHEKDGDFIHCKPIKQLCTFSGDLKCMAYYHAHGTHEWKDITEDWLSEYLKKGVCHIHGNAAHKWIETGLDSRYCEYCGKYQVKKTETVTVEKWVFE